MRIVGVKSGSQQRMGQPGKMAVVLVASLALLFVLTGVTGRSSSARAQQPPGCQGSNHRQFQLRADGTDSSCGDASDVGQQRRRATRGDERRQDIQIESAGYRRQVFVYVQAGRHVRVFLFGASEDDGQDRGEVSELMNVNPFDVEAGAAGKARATRGADSFPDCAVSDRRRL